jgi:hypothetical protein
VTQHSKRRRSTASNPRHAREGEGSSSRAKRRATSQRRRTARSQSIEEQSRTNEARRDASSQIESEEEEEEEAEDDVSQTEESRQRNDNDADFDFPVLTTRVKKISRATIESKWHLLPAEAQEKVRETLRNVARPVISSIRNNEERRIEAQDAVSSVIRKVERQLPGMPFPPTTKEFHFDHDRLLEGNRLLEKQLTPLLHSIALLKTQLGQEQAQLQEDEIELKTLERNAKDQKTARKKKYQRVCLVWR